MVNTGTDYNNQINLDGGIYNSLYGIEETQGGQNTTLLQVGDAIKDATIPFKYASMSSVGGLNEGVDHNAIATIYLGCFGWKWSNFSVNETVTGDISGVQATVVSWDPKILQVQGCTPFNTGNVNVGNAGLLYQFSEERNS